MWAVTYPSRAVGLLAPAIDRLPGPVLDYLQLVGPAVLGAIAIVNTLFPTPGSSAIAVGTAWVSVAACIAIVAWRRSLFLGLVVAVAVAIVGRAIGIP
jgi:branched-subunit amino acid transport protein